MQSTLPAPDTSSIPLPYNETVYGWSAVTNTLSIPGTKVDEFVQWCLSRCAPLSLHAHLLQLLTQCTSIEQEYSGVVYLDETNVSVCRGRRGRGVG